MNTLDKSRLILDFWFDLQLTACRDVVAVAVAVVDVDVDVDVDVADGGAVPVILVWICVRTLPNYLRIKARWCSCFVLIKSLFTTVWNTGETGDIYTAASTVTVCVCNTPKKDCIVNNNKKSS